MSDYLQVSTTADNPDVAARLARSAVEARLAAGAEVTGPSVTTFWHLGELGTGQEWRVTFRTTADRYQQLESHLIDTHPWDNPEVTAIPLTGSVEYLAWIRRTVAEPA